MSNTTVEERSQNPGSHLEEMTEGKQTLQFEKGERIYTQGNPADAVFFIQQGKVKVTAVSPAGKEATLSIHGKGDFFGLGCLSGLNGQNLRVNTATTVEPSLLLRIEKSAMVSALHQHQALRRSFIDYLLTCNTNIQEDLCDQLLHPSEKRLARVLLKLSRLAENGDEAEVILPRFSHETLSEMVGTTRSRITYFMNKFKKMGLVHYGRDLVVHAGLLAEEVLSK
jgi:CRP-like cAMP-binding protein